MCLGICLVSGQFLATTSANGEALTGHTPLVATKSNCLVGWFWPHFHCPAAPKVCEVSVGKGPCGGCDTRFVGI